MLTPISQAVEAKLPQATVLVVEDNPLIRDDAVSMLEDAGFAVVELDSADSALAYVHEQLGQVAAVFSDVEMPGRIDGFELAKAITENWPGITMLVTSGGRNLPSDFPPRARFMPKPWLPREVLATIGEAVARH